jgi:hypothetical protein
MNQVHKEKKNSIYEINGGSSQKDLKHYLISIIHDKILTTIASIFFFVFNIVTSKTTLIYQGIAQSGSAPVLGTGCRRFESCYPEKKPRARSFLLTIFLIFFYY